MSDRGGAGARGAPERPLRRDVPARRQGACRASGSSTTWSTRPIWTLSSAAVRDDTALIWVETPTNPSLRVIDLAGVLERKRGALVVVDNTFATPVHQRPLELGADAVVHSTTKYLGGHSDIGRRRGDRARSGAAREGQVRAERRRRRAGAVRLLPRPPRAAHAAPARRRARRERARGLGLAAGAGGRRRRALARLRRDGLVPASGRGPDRVVDARVLARRVARRRRVADRGAAGDDAPVGRGLDGGGARPTSCGSRAGSRRAWT